MISVTDPISDAFAHTKRILFQPVEVSTWFVLGFSAFLAELGSGGGIIAGIVLCLTCCIGALPYLSSVVLLPVSVFFRCYTLGFLAQFRQECQFLPPNLSRNAV